MFLVVVSNVKRAVAQKKKVEIHWLSELAQQKHRLTFYFR